MTLNLKYSHIELSDDKNTCFNERINWRKYCWGCMLKQECIPVGCIPPTCRPYPIASNGGRDLPNPLKADPLDANPPDADPPGCRPPLDADPLDADPSWMQTPRGQNDRQVWKHYLAQTSFAVGKKLKFLLSYIVIQKSEFTGSTKIEFTDVPTGCYSTLAIHNLPKT